MMMETTASPKHTVLRRISETISHNPIGALILTTAAISAVFYTTLNLAWNNLNSAATRIDRIAEDIGLMKASMAKLTDIEKTLLTIQASNNLIQQKLKTIRPYEARLVESFGLKVDDKMPVILYRGQTFVVPQISQSKIQLGGMRFRESTAQFIYNNNTTNGWLLPLTDASEFLPTGTTKPPSRRGR
jgi:hypothetical protein